LRWRSLPCSVSVIDTTTNMVVGSPITVGSAPRCVAVTSGGSKVYVANQNDNTVSVIATATNMVVGAPITVGKQPLAFGKFIQPGGVPFSAFTARLTVYPNQSEFSINSNFTLGVSSNGINPPTDLVTLQIGSFKTTIPPGSFVNAGAPGYYTFVGVIDGVSLQVLIKLVSGNRKGPDNWPRASSPRATSRRGPAAQAGQARCLLRLAATMPFPEAALQSLRDLPPCARPPARLPPMSLLDCNGAPRVSCIRKICAANTQITALTAETSPRFPCLAALRGLRFVG